VCSAAGGRCAERTDAVENAGGWGAAVLGIIIEGFGCIQAVKWLFEDI
jgi:hypothetical protein